MIPRCRIGSRADVAAKYAGPVAVAGGEGEGSSPSESGAPASSPESSPDAGNFFLEQTEEVGDAESKEKRQRALQAESPSASPAHDLGTYALNRDPAGELSPANVGTGRVVAHVCSESCLDFVLTRCMPHAPHLMIDPVNFGHERTHQSLEGINAAVPSDLTGQSGRVSIID